MEQYGWISLVYFDESMNDLCKINDQSINQSINQYRSLQDPHSEVPQPKPMYIIRNDACMYDNIEYVSSQVKNRLIEVEIRTRLTQPQLSL